MMGQCKWGVTGGITMLKSFFIKSVFVNALLAVASWSAHVSAESDSTSEYEAIDWVALMPADDLEALLNRPEFIDGIVDGAANDNLNSLDSMAADEQTQRYQQALSSSRVVEKFDGATIRLPGFIVPLEANEDQAVTEFFIVPYFGACLHMPPPPPNQIIHVKFEDGIYVPNLYDAFWFDGTLKINTVSNELGTSAYTMSVDNIAPYYE